MIKMTFDKGTADERFIEVQTMFEHPLRKRLSGSRDIDISKGGTIPNYDDFVGKEKFITIKVVDDDIAIPIQSGYNKITDLTVNYFSETKICNVSVMVERVEE